MMDEHHVTSRHVVRVDGPRVLVAPPLPIRRWLSVTIVALLSIGVGVALHAPLQDVVGLYMMIGAVLWLTAAPRLVIEINGREVTVTARRRVLWRAATTDVLGFTRCHVAGAAFVTTDDAALAVASREGTTVFALHNLRASEAEEAASALNRQLAATRSLTVAARGGTAG